MLIIYKKIGETPLEVIKRVKSKNPLLMDEKMTYAGRLDPMAEGLLILLVGEEIKEKDKYLGLGKEYIVEVLFGFSTDSYDILGKILKVQLETPSVENCKLKTRLNDLVGQVENYLEKFPKKFLQKYPPFSSKTINGEQMFNLAKSGELEDLEIPTKEVEIYSVELVDFYTIKKNVLEKIIFKRINLICGDFRQNETIDGWQKVFIESPDEFVVVKIKLNVSSGFYARSFANTMGENIEIPALALSIARTKIGNLVYKI